MVEEACKKGLENYMKLSDDSESKVLLTSWITAFKQFLEETGQDTIFCIYNTDNNTEDYILSTWDKCKKELVDDWVTKLTEWVGDLPLCQFDM